MTCETIYDWRWDSGLGIAYGPNARSNTAFALQAARDFAMEGDKPVHFFTDQDVRRVKGLLVQTWPELGDSASQDIDVYPSYSLPLPANHTDSEVVIVDAQKPAGQLFNKRRPMPLS